MTSMLLIMLAADLASTITTDHIASRARWRANSIVPWCCTPKGEQLDLVALILSGLLLVVNTCPSHFCFLFVILSIFFSHLSQVGFFGLVPFYSPSISIYSTTGNFLEKELNLIYSSWVYKAWFVS